uniref:NADH-ubiquinone oxidoreductase chain 3 n=1 Tax=Batophila aerata TaxID=877817 RepID=A0A3G1GRJ7_9CUCU|nr:NADH dehydrogenase subunit 3 [Batophila aerata]
MLTIISAIIWLIILILIMILNLSSKKNFYDREKNSAFECGFDPKITGRLPFSLHFFLIAIIFLIFDIEISLLIPFVLILNMTNIKIYSLIFSFFIFILLIGLFHEWNQGALNWTY